MNAVGWDKIITLILGIGGVLAAVVMYVIRSELRPISKDIEDLEKDVDRLRAGGLVTNAICTERRTMLEDRVISTSELTRLRAERGDSKGPT